MKAVVALLVLALAGACGVERDDELGARCEGDDDCPQGFFCGADELAPADRSRICVPEADCDAARFGAACAGAGFYSCVDDQVSWTSCEPGSCEDGACVE